MLRFTICAAILVSPFAMAADVWPTWRGPTSDGVIETGNPPITWSETENIKWKVPIPGNSDSTPIVWGDKMFIETVTPVTPFTPEQAESKKPPLVPYRFFILCLDRNTGETLWESTATEATPHEPHHPDTSFAPFSPVTDGEHIYASFGSRGVYCFDMDGKKIWSHEMPSLKMMGQFGEASSPALAGDAVIIVADQEGDSSIVALSKKDGSVMWKDSRDEVSTWSTPYVLEHEGRTEVIVSGTNAVRSYDPASGDVLWSCEGLTAAIPMPVVGGGNVILTSNFRGAALLAIKLGGEGDLTDSDSIAWRLDYGTPYVNSPVVYGDTIYMIEGTRPMISAFKVADGTPVYEKERIKGLRGIYSSPVAVSDRIYLAGRRGATAVIKTGDTPEVLAINELDEGFDASPVVIGDTLYLKGEKHLYCIEE